MKEESSVKVNKNNKTSWLLMAGIGLILIVVVLIFFFFMQGETKTSGGWSETEISESMSCEAEGLAYPLFKYDNANKKTTKITAIFNSGKLKTISLVQQQYYDDEDAIVRSEAENHAAMNLLMQEEGLGPDALGMNFAKLTNNLKMSLFADDSKLNGGTAKYFELDDASKYDMATMQAVYEQKGFKCVVKSE